MSTKPVYARPTSLTTAVVDETSVEVVWTMSPYANFFVLQVARDAEFEGKRVFGTDLNVNAVTVDELEPGRKYWMRVAVCNYEGVRLSPWSAVRTFRTAEA